MTYTTQWGSILDAEIHGVRARQAARLAAEHARMAQERQSVVDRAIVVAREARVRARRGHAIVLALVEP